MLDTHRLERRWRLPHGDARALFTGCIGFLTPHTLLFRVAERPDFLDLLW